jgi:hypothetical protein
MKGYLLRKTAQTFDLIWTECGLRINHQPQPSLLARQQRRRTVSLKTNGVGYGQHGPTYGPGTIRRGTQSSSPFAPLPMPQPLFPAKPSYRLIRYCYLAMLGLPLLAWGQSSPSADLLPTPMRWRATYERWKLPGSETMGMLGGTALFGINDSASLGMGSYGAVRGQRGGFITLGVAGQWSQRLGSAWNAHVGMFVGGGGGHGGSGTAGGGLMVRSDLGLSYATRSAGTLGLGISRVSFPSGVIQSTQPYLLYEHRFHTLLGSAGWSPPPSTTTGPASAEQEFSLVVRRYRIPSGVVHYEGLPQYPQLSLLGGQWRSYLHPRWFVTLETEGAMGGKSNGYMQILAGGGMRLPITTRTALIAQLAAGPAGGGRVDTGGGLLVDAELSLQQNITPRTALELGLGRVSAPSRSFKATSVDLRLTHQFGVPSVTASAVPWSALGAFEPQPLRMRVAVQDYVQGSPNWRNGDVHQSVGNLGVQLDYFLSPQWFLTGQGLAAVTGNAGAYMTGQVGTGGQWQAADRWFVEGEALLGAAGGGGLAVGGGLVWQVNAGIGYRLSKTLSVIATASQVTALRGAFAAKVVGAALAYEFTGFSRKPPY